MTLYIQRLSILVAYIHVHHNSIAAVFDVVTQSALLSLSVNFNQTSAEDSSFFVF